MLEYDVVCVVMQPGCNDHYSIKALSVAEGDRRWSMSLAEVVARIQYGGQFHVHGPDGPIDLRVFGAGYAQAYDGGIWTNDLLALPRCVVDEETADDDH